jgi:hypothetical protein
MTAAPKFLFVATHHSPHAARWIDMAADLGYDLHMFPLKPRPPHHKMRDLTLHVPVLDDPSNQGKRTRG